MAIIVSKLTDLVLFPHTVILFYYASCEHFSFDPQQPTSRDGGKPKVIQQLKDELGLTSIVMVGDGVTDMQARPPADAFIGA